MDHKRFEAILTPILIAVTFVLSIHMKDSPIVTISAVFGLLYTIYAGRGKAYCYLFGMIGTLCHSYISFQQMLWGSFLLYIGYYFPMEIAGLFLWSKNLNSSKNEVQKASLSPHSRKIFAAAAFVAIVLFAIVLKIAHCKYPILDSLTTILSICGLYLTVRRCLEQWIVWTLVNFLSIIVWAKIFISGEKTFATLLMWCVYFMLGIYFYFRWKKELKD